MWIAKTVTLAVVGLPKPCLLRGKISYIRAYIEFVIEEKSHLIYNPINKITYNKATVKFYQFIGGRFFAKVG